MMDTITAGIIILLAPLAIFSWAVIGILIYGVTKFLKELF